MKLKITNKYNNLMIKNKLQINKFKHKIYKFKNKYNHNINKYKYKINNNIINKFKIM